VLRKIESQILSLVRSASYQPVKPAVIAKKLGLANDAARELKKVIKQMASSPGARAVWCVAIKPANVVYLQVAGG
jgi:hypothetical protein